MRSVIAVNGNPKTGSLTFSAALKWSRQLMVSPQRNEVASAPSDPIRATPVMVMVPVPQRRVAPEVSWAFRGKIGKLAQVVL